GQPGVELGAWHGLYLGPHQRVGQTAELGTVGVVGARLVGLEPQDRLLARHQVALAVELRHPEVVDHVLRGHEGTHLFVRRYDHRVGGLDLDPVGDAFQVRVAELEPPLVADDLHAHGVWRAFGQVEHGAHRGDGDRGQDQGRDDRPDHLQLGVAVDLLRLLAAGAVPEEDRGDDDRQLYEEEDTRCDPEDRPEQVVDLAGERALGVQGIEGSVLDIWRDQLTR